MKKVMIILFVVAATLTETLGQQHNFMLHMGVGTFSMKTQKNFQSKFTNYTRFPVNMKAVDKFPPYWTYGASVSVKPFSYYYLGIGLMFEAGSTGGRLDYNDYSGSARLDQLLKYKQFGFNIHVPLNRSTEWTVLANIGFSLVKTKEHLEFTVTADDQTSSDTGDFKSTNFSFRPGISVQRKVRKFLFEGSLAGDFQPASVLKDSDGNHFRSPDENITAQWSGLRAQLGVGVLLGQTKVEEY